MDPEDKQPFDRDAWRRLMASDSGAPTKEMDARVLAAARRALTPRIGRWWFPASLAASLLLAVLIVQWQLADTGRPVPVTESDVLAVPAPIAADESAAAAASELPAQRREQPAMPAAEVPPPMIDMPPAESWSEPATAPPSTTPAAESATDAATAIAPVPEPAREQAVAPPGMTMAKLRATESYAESRTPEQWYADIKALRAAGRIEEADAELARLKSRYPGWLESHQKKDP